MARACGAAWACTWTTTELHQTSCSTTGPRQASCSTSVQLRKFITIRQFNSQNQFENNKCITFPSASSSLIRFSNASAFAIASSRSFVRCSIRRLKSSAGTTEPSDPDATAPAPLDPLIGWRWKRRALDWLAMEKESRARLQVPQQRPAKLR